MFEWVGMWYCGMKKSGRRISIQTYSALTKKTRFCYDLLRLKKIIAMFLDVLESRGQGTIFAFGFMKKYLFLKKLQPKTFCVTFFSNWFGKSIISKNINKQNIQTKTKIFKI